ncbi:MAG: hypothetical protein N2Z58_06945 [Fervidobacterium sp.]|nr:hypothetical protein [Fervidobacterium sp.]
MKKGKELMNTLHTGLSGCGYTQFFVLFILIFFVSHIFAVIDEETARNYFSQSLLEMYSGNFSKAYELSKKALSGRVYVNELSHFWFLRGRLAIANGLIDKAVEDFKTFTQLVRNDDIENLIQRVDYFRKLNLSPSKTFELKYINSASGIVNGIEYFHTPVSVAVFGDNYCVLDSRNKRIVFFKNNRMTRIKKVINNIKQLFYDREGNMYLLSDKSLYDANELELLGNLKAPYVAGVDRAGNIYLIDFDKVIMYNTYTKSAVEKKLPYVTFTLDAEITVDKLYILDGLRQTIDVYNLKSLSKVDGIKLKEKIWSFEVTPYGDIIYLGKNKVVAGMQEFDIKTGDLIEYSYPTLFLISWKNKSIDIYTLKDDKPIFVNIDTLRFDDKYAYAYVRVEDLFGDEIHYIQHSLSIFEHDVYVPSETTSASVQAKYLSLQNCNGEVISYKLQGVWAIGNCPIMSKFTGAPSDGTLLGRKTRINWIIKWSYMRPVPPGVIKLTAKVSFKNASYFDTSFYTHQLIKAEQLRKE